MGEAIFVRVYHTFQVRRLAQMLQLRKFNFANLKCIAYVQPFSGFEVLSFYQDCKIYLSPAQRNKLFFPLGVFQPGQARLCNPTSLLEQGLLGGATFCLMKVQKDNVIHKTVALPTYIHTHTRGADGNSGDIFLNLQWDWVVQNAIIYEELRWASTESMFDSFGVAAVSKL